MAPTLAASSMVLGDLLDQFDPRSDVRGKQFERLCAWYLRNAPEYRHRIRRVWLWAEWPSGWGQDLGIDLVAEDHDGSLWAIQAKAKDANNTVTKAEMDSFISASSRLNESGGPMFSFRLLMATTDRLSNNARYTMDALGIHRVMRSDLERAALEWPSSPDDLLPAALSPKTPFPHVQEAIDATVKGFEGRLRGQVIMACGTGKTLAALWISEKLASTRTLVLMPSLSLLKQTLREWTANSTTPFDYLAVCSDEGVVEKDEAVQHTADLGVPVTTDAATIATFLRRRGRRVVFGTYQSSREIAAAFDNGRTPHFDLAVADEAHRCTGVMASGTFTTILDAKKIKARRRLFMTATPRFYTERVRKAAGEQDQAIASMDDETVFGPVLHRLTFGKAIECGLLSNYQVVVVGVTGETYATLVKSGKSVKPDGQEKIDARTLAAEIALAKTMRKYDLHRVISFHNTIKAGRQFSHDLPEVIRWMPARTRPKGATWVEHVSGGMSTLRRDRMLWRLRNLEANESGLLANARCLSEGVDVPTLDGVAFIEPRRSVIDIIQCVGRAIRKAPNKIGTVVLPVFLTDDENPEKVLDDSTFEDVWRVLKALAAHDETLREELDELRVESGARPTMRTRRPGQIKLDVPVAVFGVQFIEAFNVRLIEHTTSSWEFSFGRLLRFVDREGHSQVPSSYRDEEGFKLGFWVTDQRTKFNAGTLDAGRQRRLEDLPLWTWDARETSWEQGLARLQDFADREGHSRVPLDYKTEDGFALGSWVNTRRIESRAGTLDAERAARLEAVRGWMWDPLDADWEEGFARLTRYEEAKGHSRVPFSYRDDDGYRLGTWVDKQRQSHSHGRLSNDRTKRLEALSGWVWSVKEARWEEGYARLVQFAEREGHNRVPNTYRDVDGFGLGGWVATQRQNRKRHQLAREEQCRLEAVPGWTWDVLEARWEEGFTRLVRFARRKGHSRVSGSYREQDGFRLGAWVNTQRQSYGHGRLSNERIQQLEALPGWAWSIKQAHWDEGYERLLKFSEREGHSQVPALYRDADGFRLGGWVVGQRQRFVRGQLSEEQTRRLEAVLGWTWHPRDMAWEQGFMRLRRFVNREGHARVPTAYVDDGGFRLGQWVDGQRQRRRRGSLTDEQTRRLESLPGWCWDRQEAAWEDGYARLLQFVARERHVRVPRDYRDDDGFKLGQWVNKQRALGRRGKLPNERVQKLESVPGWTWGRIRAPTSFR